MSEENRLTQQNEMNQENQEEMISLFTSIGQIIASNPVLLQKYERLLNQIQFLVRLDNNLNPHQVIVDEHELNLLMQLRQYSFDDIVAITQILQNTAHVLYKTYESSEEDAPKATVRKMQHTSVQISHLSNLMKNANAEWRTKKERVQHEVVQDM